MDFGQAQGRRTQRPRFAPAPDAPGAKGIVVSLLNHGLPTAGVSACSDSDRWFTCEQSRAIRGRSLSRRPWDRTESDDQGNRKNCFSPIRFRSGAPPEPTDDAAMAIGQLRRDPPAKRWAQLFRRRGIGLPTQRAMAEAMHQVGFLRCRSTLSPMGTLAS